MVQYGTKPIATAGRTKTYRQDDTKRSVVEELKVASSHLAGNGCPRWTIDGVSRVPPCRLRSLPYRIDAETFTGENSSFKGDQLSEVQLTVQDKLY